MGYGSDFSAYSRYAAVMRAEQKLQERMAQVNKDYQEQRKGELSWSQQIDEANLANLGHLVIHQAKFEDTNIRFFPRFVPWSGYAFGAINTDVNVYMDYLKNGLSGAWGKHLMHEYGHHLQELYGGTATYYMGVFVTSPINLLMHSTPYYNSTWTEVQANTMSYYYFHYPKGFAEQYPINSDYISDELKSLLYYHKLK